MAALFNAIQGVFMSNEENKTLADQADKSHEQTTPSENQLIVVPKKRSHLARNPLIILASFFLMIVVFVIILGIGCLYVAKTTFENPGPSVEDTIVMIKPGTGIRGIATTLEKQNLLHSINVFGERSSDIFVGGVHYYKSATALKAGEYNIPAKASMHDIMDILVKGQSLEYTITIPEGLTVQQIFDRIAANDLLVGPLPKQLAPEGSLMTTTVKFLRGTSRTDIIKRLSDGQTKLVKEIWNNRAPDLPIKTINEFVTLASIIEKETGIASERPQVAAVFYNRLNKNMRLQSDPTVIYGIFGGKGKPSDRPIYRSDLDKENSYNTYRINGLPPTPIANPGKDALQAVANPPHTDAFYFVADGTGGHVFSKTLDEHNNNVKKWRSLQSNQPENTTPSDTNIEQTQ